MELSVPRSIPSNALLINEVPRRVRKACGQNVNRSTIFRWCEKGILPSKKIGSRRFVREDDLVEFLTPIARAAGETPFLFYDNPSRAHVDFPPALTLNAMMESIPNFAGVKLTRCDLENLEQAVETCGDDAQK